MNFSLENQTNLNSTTNNTSTEDDDLFPLVSFLVTTIVLLPVGIVGNLLVIVAVKKKRYLRTKTNVLLANLAGADLFACILGYSVASARTFPSPTAARVLCKVNSYYPAFSFISILTLTMIALERYNAIVKPLSTGFKFSRRTLRYFITAIWIISTLVATPLVYFNHFNSDYGCARTWSAEAQMIFWTTAFFIAILLPLLVLIYCYLHIIRALYFGRRIIPMNLPVHVDAREKKRVIKLSIVVTLVFFLAFAPFVVVKELQIHGLANNELQVFSLISVLLSSILNPFIYAFQSSNYRRAFRELITCRDLS